MENTTKSRYWILLIFQDNWEKNPNWREKLIDTHIRFCVSPLHDKDKWSELDIEKHPEREEYIKEHLGEPKTPHYHVMMHPSDNKTFKTMKELTDSLGLPIPKVCPDPSGFYYYFTHEFNKEKYHYDVNDIRHYNGSDASDYIMDISKRQRSVMMHELSVKFREKKFTKYGDMEDFAYELNNPNYVWLVQTNISYFKQFLVDNVVTLQQKKLEDRKNLENVLPKGRFYDGK